jgi:hypothetical protein
MVSRDLRRQLLLAVTLTLAGGLVGAAYGWTRIPEVLGFAWLIAGVLLIFLSAPLWGAREWARITVASIAGALAIAHMITAFTAGNEGRELGAGIASITYSAYFWLPSMREVFHEAREARARDLAVLRRRQKEQERA